jgi:hypothetical protein
VQCKAIWEGQNVVDNQRQVPWHFLVLLAPDVEQGQHDIFVDALDVLEEAFGGVGVEAQGSVGRFDPTLNIIVNVFGNFEHQGNHFLPLLGVYMDDQFVGQSQNLF